MDSESLNLEIELIESSLLPAEHLTSSQEGWPIVLEIHSSDSSLSIRITLSEGYPEKQDVSVEVRGEDFGREESESWKTWVHEKMGDWKEEGDYPLFQLLTTHLLPLLAPQSAPASPKPDTAVSSTVTSSIPHHALLTSHHLLAPSKRKDLHTLSSQLSLVGFAKTGHPGIMYATGQKEDLLEWVREVKSWQWLALRVRVTPEPLGHLADDGQNITGGKGKEEGARGGKGRGEWTEVEKVGEAVEWMKGVGREKLLTDFGIGVGSDHS